MACPEENILSGFSGNAAWIHAREGSGLAIYGRSCYWPGGASGVTLDPGFDLGYQEPKQLFEHYTDVLTEEQMQACVNALGLKGSDAEYRVQSLRVLRSIKISHADQERLFPLVFAPYWEEISSRFVPLADAPGPVQTALGSLAYNRGAGNRALGVLEAPLRSADWKRVGAVIAQMQQQHQLRSIQLRRRLEGALIVQPVLSRQTPTPYRSVEDAALRNAQEQLREEGHYAGGVDGAYGQGTEQAVIDLQETRGLTVDGIIGPEVWGALLSEAIN